MAVAVVFNNLKNLTFVLFVRLFVLKAAQAPLSGTGWGGGGINTYQVKIYNKKVGVE